MKKFTLIILIGFLLITSCKKNKVCKSFTELSNDKHLVDINDLSSAPEFLDTLSKYPQLQVFKIIDDAYMIGMHCNVFYEGLPVFTESYRLFKSKSNNSISGWDTIPMDINISKTPSIQYEQAIEIAKQTLEFKKSCISYHLGISDKNSGVSYQPKAYKLTWKIQGENGLPFVIIDANSGEVYSSEDGVHN